MSGKEILKLMAKDHINGMIIVKIAEKYNLSPRTASNRLRRYSETVSWYDYKETVIKNSNYSRKHRVVRKTKTDEEISKSIYNTFLLLKKEEGLTDTQAWEEMHKIWEKYEVSAF